VQEGVRWFGEGPGRSVEIGPWSIDAEN